MSKLAYASYQKDFHAHRNKMAFVDGIVTEKIQAEKYTKLTIECTNFEHANEIKELFFVYFTKDIKTFVDKYVREKYLVNITCNLYISSKSTKKQQIIILEGRHIYIYKNFVNVYDEPVPVKTNPLKFNDNAY